MIDLRGKTVLVTGGSRGIGEAIVRAVAAQGAKVLLHYGKSLAPAEAIRDAVGREACELIQADLGDVNAPAHLWSQATAAAGRIDVLVNNAGIFEVAPINVAIDAWQRSWAHVMQVNLTARQNFAGWRWRIFKNMAAAGSSMWPAARPIGVTLRTIGPMPPRKARLWR